MHTDAAVVSLQRFLQYETVCTPGEELNVAAAQRSTFLAAEEYLHTTYAALLGDAKVQAHKVNDYSMLVVWRGTQPELPALLTYGHYDVVPVDSNSRKSWLHAPFGGVVRDRCALLWLHLVHVTHEVHWLRSSFFNQEVQRTNASQVGCWGRY